MYFAFLNQEDLNKANEDLLRRREIKKEQEVAEEHKVVEYMKKKAVSINFCHKHAKIWPVPKNLKCNASIPFQVKFLMHIYHLAYIINDTENENSALIRKEKLHLRRNKRESELKRRKKQPSYEPFRNEPVMSRLNVMPSEPSELKSKPRENGERKKRKRP